MRHLLTFIIAFSICLVATAKPTRANLGGSPPKDTKGSLPYDAEVEYIGTVNQPSSIRSYIDTGVVLQEADGYLHQFKVRWRATNQGAWGWFAYNLTGGTWLGSSASSDSGIYFGSYTSRYRLNPVPADYADYELDSSTGLSVDGTLIHSAVVAPTTAAPNPRGRTLPFFLFYDIRFDGQYSRVANCNYASVKIEVDGILVRDLVPVRITNEQGRREGAMYDRVNGKIYRNVGNGAFEIGPDKN